MNQLIKILNETVHQLDPCLDKIQNSEEFKELLSAFKEIQQPRPDYVLEKFVIGSHDTTPQQYAQCVLEMQIKYTNIRKAILYKKKIFLKIKQLEEKGDEISMIDADLKRIDAEEQDYAIIGALREFTALYKIFKGFTKKFTREELNNAQEEYWHKRLTRQANQDLMATGRIGIGSQEALMQIGKPITPAALPMSDEKEVEQKFLAVGNIRLLLVVPTEKQATEGLPCIQKLTVPNGMQIKVFNIFGRTIDNAYNESVLELFKDKADFMLTIEDDTFPPSNALIKMIRVIRDRKEKIIVGGWYPKRVKGVREGTPIVLRDNIRHALDDDGEIHECYTIPMGCTLFPASVFTEVNFPWFLTTENLTQDSFFCQKARDAGWKLLCDTSIRCKHTDRNTGEVFE